MSVSNLVKCCIPGCTTTKVQGKMFKFPSSKELFPVWKTIFERKFPDVKINVDKGGRCQKYVCFLHFEEKHLISGRNRDRFAIPTLFTRTEIDTKKPACPMTIDISGLNDYTRIISLATNSAAITTETRKRTLSDDDGVDDIAITNNCTLSSVSNAKDSKNNHQDGVISHEEISTAASNLNDRPTTPVTTQELPVDAANVGTADINRGKRGATPPPKRTRVVKSVKTLTPRCNRIYHKCMEALKSKRRLVMSAQQRLKKAERLMEEKSFDAMVEQLPKHTRTFISMQINALNKNVKLRRFSNEEKLLALTLMKQSPKGYKLLQKLFVLPSRRTLNTFTHDFVLKPGLNVNVLAQLKESVTKWDEKKKACSIVFDEIALSPNLTFIEAQDSISGFVDFGKGREKRLCDHALVFMVRGIVTSWRQVLAFYYCEGATPAVTLKNILREVVEAISETGLVPMALVCDQGSTFQTTLKSFQADTKQEQLRNNIPESHKINISGHQLYIFYDPPHLIKGVRNNLLNKDLSFNGKTATWKDLIEVYKTDCRLGKIRLLPKITDDHINPSSSQRMKVKICTQALSERMSAALHYTSRYETHCDGTQVSRTMKNTAEAVEFFDKLFDSVNGSRSAAGAKGKMRGPVKDDLYCRNKHVSFWRGAIGILQNSFFFESRPDGHITKK